MRLFLNIHIPDDERFLPMEISPELRSEYLRSPERFYVITGKYIDDYSNLEIRDSPKEKQRSVTEEIVAPLNNQFSETFWLSLIN